MAIALTGGIACGKSTLAKFLRELGIRLLDADDVVHELEAPGGAAVPAIAARFGAGILAADGSVDRPKLAGIVFADAAARRDLEAILLPLVRSRLRAFTSEAARRGRRALPTIDAAGRECQAPTADAAGRECQVPTIDALHWENHVPAIDALHGNNSVSLVGADVLGRPPSTVSPSPSPASLPPTPVSPSPSLAARPPSSPVASTSRPPPTDPPLAIAVIPLLFESHWEDDYDTILAITSPLACQIRRMMQTRGYSRRQAEARLAAQMPAAEKAARADFVVVNDSTPEHLREEAGRLYAWLKEKEQNI